MQIQPNISGIISQAYEIFKKKFKSIFIVTLIVYVPINLVTELIKATRVDYEEWIFLYTAESFVTLFGLLALIGIALITKSATEGKELDWQEALILAFNRWPKVLATNILAGIMIIPLFLFLIVPGIIFAVYWFFITYVVIFSNHWGVSALFYSMEMVQNRWWKTLGFAIVLGIIGFFIALLSALPNIILPEGIGYNVLGSVPIDMAMAFTTVIATIFYLAWDATKIKKSS